MGSEDQQQILDIKVKYEDAIYGIIRYKEKIEQLKSAIDDLKKQEKDGTITRNEMKVQTEAINATIKEYQYNVRTLQKEIQNNVRTENEQEGSLKQLRAQLSNATKKYDEMSKAEREGAKGQELAKHINEITEQLKLAEEQTQRYYRNVGNYYNSMLDLAADLQHVVPMGGGGGVGEGIGNFADKVVTLGKNVKDVIPNIKAFATTLLGLAANPIFISLAGVVGAGVAFKWFVDYNKGLEEATRLTQQFTGLAGNELKGVRNEVLALSSTFDLEFSETMQSANSMAKAFGISVSDALKLMQDGLVSGANANGEFIDTLKEYPRYFKEAGLGAEELVAIATQATKEGIFSDKGVDTIKEGNLRLREMTAATTAALDGIGISSKQVQKDLQDGSKTTFQVMQEVGNKLKELPQTSAAVGTAIADIFGGPGEDAGLKYIEMLGDIELNMDKVKEKQGDIAKAQEDELNATKDLQNAMATLFDFTGGGFEMMKTQLSTLAKKSLTEVIQATIKAVNYFIDWYNESMLLRTVVQALGVLFVALGQTIKAVGSVVLDVFKQLARSGKGLLDMLEGIATLDFDKAAAGLKQVFDFSGLMREGWSDLEKAGSAMANAVVSGYNNTINNAKLEHIEPVDASGSSQEVSATPSASGKSAVPATAAAGGGKTKTKKTTDEEKEEAKRLKAQQEQLQKEIAQITYDYNEKVMDAKKRFLADMYDNDKDYQADLDQLEKEMISDCLNAYVQAGQIGNEKAQEMQQKLLDTMLKAKANIKAQAKEIVDAIKTEFDELEKKRRDANIMNGGTGDDEDTEGKLQRYQEFLNQKLAMTQDNTEAQKMLQEELYDTEIGLQEEANKKKKQLTTQQLEVMSQMISTLGDGLASFFDEEELTLHSFLKTMLTSVLDAIEIAVTAYYAQILAKEIAGKSWAGVASAAGLMALIKIAFAGAKALVKSFSTGGYVQGSGTGTSDSIPARLSNGESVMTAKATSMFSPILSAFNQLGGGVPIVVSNNQSNIGMDMIAAAVAKGYMMAPQPVVSVEEISRVQKRVGTRERIGTM